MRASRLVPRVSRRLWSARPFLGRESSSYAASEDARALDAARLLLRRREEQTFRLDDSFVAQYAELRPPFGFNGLGELVYLRTYSRPVADLETGGFRSEQWHETVRRVVEGCFSLQWRHCEGVSGLGFDLKRANSEAREMFDEVFHMRFLPPGRGLWAMGTAVTEERATFAALNNCAFVSTSGLGRNPRGAADPFCFLMDAAMLGVGVGFDTKGAGTAWVALQSSTGAREPAESANIKGSGAGSGAGSGVGSGAGKPAERATREPRVHVVGDSREGWVASLRALLEAYLRPLPPYLEAKAGEAGSNSIPGVPVFDYSALRPAGSPIKGFGGTSQGCAPLRELHESLRRVLDAASGGPLSERLIVDVMNLVGKCVVSSNVRRTAEIAFGALPDAGPQPTAAAAATAAAATEKQGGDGAFWQLKDYDRHPERAAFGWVSNNSVMAMVGRANYGVPEIAQNVALNGEVGEAGVSNTAV